MRHLMVVIPPDNPRSHLAPALSCLHGLIHDSDWELKVVYLNDTPATGEFCSPWDLSQWRRDGRLPDAVIWYYARMQDLQTICALVSSGVAVVTYNRDYTSLGAYGVVADVTDVAATQFRNLFTAGKRRFAVIGVDRPSPSIRQYTCTVSALVSQHGLIDDFQHLTLPYTATHRPNDGMMGRIEQLMSGKNAPDAVLCADIFSFRGMELWLATHPQVRVPEDLGVATFDPISHTNVLRLQRQIPSAQIDEPRMLRQALDLIEQQLGGMTDEPRAVRVPAVMVEGGWETSAAMMPAMTARVA